ncbi:MAG: hybrid sensor histidine kinase/response regulator [bacterium]
MDREKLLQRLIGIFLTELDEHVLALNESLVALEKNPPEAERVELVACLFRAVHSLKGAARAVSIAPIEVACHRLEEILLAARERGVLDPDRFALCYETADALEDAGQRLRTRQDLADSPLALLNAQLGEAAEAPVTATVAAPVTPVPAETESAAASESTGPAAVSEPEPVAEIAHDAHTAAIVPVPPHVNGVNGANGADRAALPPVEVAPAWPISAASSGPAVPISVARQLRADVGGILHDGGSVRIAARKLDAFLSQSGEVLLARGRVAARLETLGGLHDLAEQWKNEWRAVEKLIAGLNDEQRNGSQASSAQARRCAPILARTGSNLGRLERDLGRLVVALAEDERALAHATGGLDTEVRRVRMLPFAEACQGLDRLVRDLAHHSGKEVELVISGSGIEIDRAILEGLSDPLIQLVRNAVDHGVESVADRVAAGKPARARIEVSAMLRGAQIEVNVHDDGRGLDMEAIRAKAVKKNLPVSADNGQTAQLIFLPGFSTAALITEVSGRGVGLDVVKSKIEAMRGTVYVLWEMGLGTRFVLTAPLTLTTVRAVILRAGGQTFAIDGTPIQRMVHVRPDEIRSIEGREMVFLGGEPVPVTSLAHTLGIRTQSSAPSGARVPAVVLVAGAHQVAFVVDQLLAEQVVVVKNLGARLKRLRYVSGATMLSDGQVVFILNAADLMRGALASTAVDLAPATFGAEGQQAKKRILVTDDSVTSRSMMQTMLDAAGYDVMVTVDGGDAWQVLQERGADLVVSDVEMPRMDGFTLTETIRHSTQFRDLPVVLVTARATDQDKARGLEAGANAYLVKSTFDQQSLLDVVAQLL